MAPMYPLGGWALPDGTRLRLPGDTTPAPAPTSGTAPATSDQEGEEVGGFGGDDESAVSAESRGSADFDPTAGGNAAERQLYVVGTQVLGADGRPADLPGVGPLRYDPERQVILRPEGDPLDLGLSGVTITHAPPPQADPLANVPQAQVPARLRRLFEEVAADHTITGPELNALAAQATDRPSQDFVATLRRNSMVNVPAASGPRVVSVYPAARAGLSDARDAIAQVAPMATHSLHVTGLEADWCNPATINALVEAAGRGVQVSLEVNVRCGRSHQLAPDVLLRLDRAGVRLTNHLMGGGTLPYETAIPHIRMDGQTIRID